MRFWVVAGPKNCLRLESKFPQRRLGRVVPLGWSLVTLRDIQGWTGQSPELHNGRPTALSCRATESDTVSEKQKGDNKRAKSFRHFLTLFHTFPHFFTLFHTFPSRVFLKIKAFFKENKQKNTKPFCTLVVARLSSSKILSQK